MWIGPLHACRVDVADLHHTFQHPVLASMLDLNGDGNALDDILRMAGKVMRR